MSLCDFLEHHEMKATNICVFLFALIVSGCGHQVADQSIRSDEALLRILLGLRRAGVNGFGLQPMNDGTNKCYYLRLENVPGHDLDFLRGCSLSGLTVRHARSIRDISGLSGCSLSALYLLNGNFTNIECLRNMPLREISLSGCPIRSIEILRGMELRILDIKGTSVETLEPLQHMTTLKYLDFSNTQIKDLSPLTGMELQWLICSDLVNTNDHKLQAISAEHILTSDKNIGRGNDDTINMLPWVDSTKGPLDDMVRSYMEGHGSPFPYAAVREGIGLSSLGTIAPVPTPQLGYQTSTNATPLMIK